MSSPSTKKRSSIIRKIKKVANSTAKRFKKIFFKYNFYIKPNKNRTNSLVQLDQNGKQINSTIVNTNDIANNYDPTIMKGISKSRLPQNSINIKYYEENVNANVDNVITKRKLKIFKDEENDILYIPIHLAAKYNIDIDENIDGKTELYEILYKRKNKLKIVRLILFYIIIFTFGGFILSIILLKMLYGKAKWGFTNRIIAIKFPPGVIQTIKTNKAFDIEQLRFKE